MKIQNLIKASSKNHPKLKEENRGNNRSEKCKLWIKVLKTECRPWGQSMPRVRHSIFNLEIKL